MPKILGKRDGEISGKYSLQSRSGFPVVSKTSKDCYIVLGDTVNDTDDIILRTTEGLPRIGLVNGSFMYCIGLEAKELGTIIHPTTHVKTILWEVAVDYSSNLDDEASSNSNDNQSDPENLRPRRRSYTEKTKEHLEFDAITGQPTVNANGEKLEIEHDVWMIIMEIERYEKEFDQLTTLKYVGRLNEQEFYGAPKGSVLLDDRRVEEEYINGVLYHKVCYVFKFKIKEIPESTDIQTLKSFFFLEAPPILEFLGYDSNGFQYDTWVPKILHQGYLYRPVDPDNTTILEDPVPFLKNGQPQKVNLDAEGRINETDQPVFLTINETTYKDFGPLNLQY